MLQYAGTKVYAPHRQIEKLTSQWLWAGPLLRMLGLAGVSDGDVAALGLMSASPGLSHQAALQVRDGVLVYSQTLHGHECRHARWGTGVCS